MQSEAVHGDGFADRLAARYQQRLSGETLMVNEVFVSLVYRPVTGAATGLAARWLSRGGRGTDGGDLTDALDVCEKLGQTLRASLARYEPESLGVYNLRRQGALPAAGVPGAAGQRGSAAGTFAAGSHQ